MLASHTGHCVVVRLLVKKGADVNAATHNGCAALMLASYNGHYDIVRLLLENKAEVSAAEKDGWTALMLASRNGHCVVVRLLVKRGADVNAATHNGWTALMLASYNGHYDIVRLLLENKAEVSAAEKDGWTALMLASRHGHCDVFGLLLGMEVNAPKQNSTPTLASQGGHCGSLAVLVKRKPIVYNFTIPFQHFVLQEEEEEEIEAHGLVHVYLFLAVFVIVIVYVFCIHPALKRTSKWIVPRQSGWIALMSASQNGDYNAVQRLLSGRKTDVNVTDEHGRTALMLAARNGHCDVARLLLESAAEVNASDEDGCTALMLASQTGHSDVVKLLQDSGADVNAAKQDGRTALMLAICSAECDAVRQLLNKGAEVNLADQNGWTPLMLASQNGHCDVDRLLLDSEAEVNASDKDGSAALSLASHNSHSVVVKLLLDREADVNAAQQDGWTALMLASNIGFCDAVKLLLNSEAEVNAAAHNGWTALMLASRNNYCDVVKLLLKNEAEVNATIRDDWTALMLASQEGYGGGWNAFLLASKKGHFDIVKLLLENKAEGNAAVRDGWTALMFACQKSNWNLAKLLIDHGANVLHTAHNGEMAAMYIIFAETANNSNNLTESISDISQNLMFTKSKYAMDSSSFALTSALLYNTTSKWSDCYFAKSALHENVLYAFLPEFIFDDYRQPVKYPFHPYQGLEGKISLHTQATAVVCKLPHAALQWLTAHHRAKLVNMLGQTPLHLLAMENHILDDMGEKIHLLTETVGFSFSNTDNNGRVPYHIACLCLNGQFLLCGLRQDSEFRKNILVQDHQRKTPLAYMTYLLHSTTKYCGILSLKLLSVSKVLNVLSQNMVPDSPIDTQLRLSISARVTRSTVDSLVEHFKCSMTVDELAEVIKKAKNVYFATDDIASLFQCSSRGIVSLTDKQHANIICSVMQLLHLVGTEMGKIDRLFKCVPVLKGSVQEYTKCGELDELDTSMKLVNFTDYFSTHLIENGIKVNAYVQSLHNRCWNYGNTDVFSSEEYCANGCANFWQILLKAFGTKVIMGYIKYNRIIIENCKRKNGFVGMLNISCPVGDSIQSISVDITPSIENCNLEGYMALLRPRHYDNKSVGDDFSRYHCLELSSSQKDWDFLKFLQPELMSAYALVKMLRSLADTFQTKKGKVYTAEDILPSYMVKTALLWILDPEEKRSKIYKGLDLSSIFESEYSSSYKNDVLGLCQKLLQDTKSPNLGYIQQAKDIGKTSFQSQHHSNISRCLDDGDVKMLLDISKKCTTGTGYLTVRERILPYVLDTKHPGRQQQNGINLQWMQENCNQYVQVISDQDERSQSRMIYADSETGIIWREHESDNKRAGQLSHHNIPYPDVSEETARQCRVWAIRMLRLLPHLLQYKGNISVGQKTINVVGVRNYYLPDQEIYARDKDLAVALCRVLEAVLE